MPEDANIKRELERRTGWTPQNRRYHVTRLGTKIGSEKFALYVRAHQAGIKLGDFDVDDETLLKVGTLAEENPPAKELSQPNNGSSGKGKGSRRRGLSTIMFVDIVDSTRLRSELGNRKYSKLMVLQTSLRDRLLKRHTGRFVKSTGDGFLATFSLPTNSVRCSLELAEDTQQLDLEVRIGLHTAEIVFDGGDVDGLGVHIAARVEAAAEPGQVWVSSTVQGALAGSEFQFESTGQRELKGVAGQWELFVATLPN